LKKNGRADETVNTAITRLKRFAKLCNVQDPEQVKTIIATAKWCNNTKRDNATTCDQYFKFVGIKWNKPIYKKEHKIPFIPTEEELDSLIACGTNKTATLLQTLKETGARIGEIIPHLKWTDLDFQRKAITIRKPEKGSNSRILPISDKLISMLGNLPKINDKVFQTNKHNIRRTYDELRKRAIKKLANPRLHKICFHTFRHFKGTMEYHKTKDIIHVQQVLGHKSIKSTMVYIHIEQALWLASTDEWTTKVSHNIKEDQQLIEAGFEYITEREGLKIYRKRK